MKKKKLEKNYHQKISDSILNNNFKIGCMQGRLLPKYRNRFQAFPLNNWEKEFKLASNLNLDFIEFIFDKGKILDSPIFTKNGRNQIFKLSKFHNIKVLNVCADYFMFNLLINNKNQINLNSKKILIKLIKNCSEINIKNIILPFVDHSSLKNNIFKLSKLISLLNSLKNLQKKYKINLALETDLSPETFKLLLKNIKNDRIKINYDVGNSASFGYDIDEEFKKYGKYISVIHIKDRIFNGKSVTLGKGNVNFTKFFINIKNLKSKVPLTMQAYRDQKGIDLFKKQYNWFNNKLKKS